MTYFLEMASKEDGIRGFLDKLRFHFRKALLLKYYESHKTIPRQSEAIKKAIGAVVLQMGT